MEGRRLVEDRCLEAQSTKDRGQQVKRTQADDARQAITVPQNDQQQGREPGEQQQAENQCQTGEQQQADGSRFLFLQFNAEQLDVSVQQAKEGSAQAPR